jgi:hypothetical protein
MSNESGSQPIGLPEDIDVGDGGLPVDVHQHQGPTSILAADVEPRLLMLRLAIGAACVLYAGRPARVSKWRPVWSCARPSAHGCYNLPYSSPGALAMAIARRAGEDADRGSLFDGTEDSSFMTYSDLLFRFSSFLSRRFSSFA